MRINITPEVIRAFMNLKIVRDLTRYRQRIIDEAVAVLTAKDFFSGFDRPAESVARAVCEGLLDLLTDPDRSSDPRTVEMFMERLYNLIRKKSLKVDTTLEFLDTFEGIVRRPLDNVEDRDIDAFFSLCRSIIRQRHKELARKLR
ncbi:hypothetical protein [Methanocella conradii]|nr:hypothetical protein [Methanocella conradii]